ncbi:MAG: META domain-containing protein [Roseinatronobacter sp.]
MVRFFPVLLCCLALAAPADARDLVVSLTWDIAADAELVTVLRRADGMVLSSTRAAVVMTDQHMRVTLADIPRQTASLQAALVGTNTIWAQSPVTAIEPRSDTVVLDLSRHLSIARTHQFECAESLGIATLRLQDQALSLSTDSAVLLPVGQEPTEWSFADTARLTLAGSRLRVEMASGESATCPGLPTRPLLPLHVRGEDGVWHMDLRGDGAAFRLTLDSTDQGTRDASLAARREDDGTIIFTDPEFDLRLSDQICSLGDDLVPYPMKALLERADMGAPRAGCAGAPVDLLTGPEWKVTSLLGRALGPEMTLSFSGVEVAGRSSCNRYLAALHIEGGQLSLRDLGTTRLGCDLAARNLEQRFLNALEGVSGFEIGRDGSLILRAGVTAVLTARRK